MGAVQAGWWQLWRNVCSFITYTSTLKTLNRILTHPVSLRGCNVWMFVCAHDEKKKVCGEESQYSVTERQFKKFNQVNSDSFLWRSFKTRSVTMCLQSEKQREHLAF